MPVPVVTRPPPQYRRSASTLDGWTPLPPRQRPLSLVSLSAGRSALATPSPRVEHDSSLARALSTLEVPGARLSRVLQGRGRLFHSGSSSCVLSYNSTGSSVSPPSPRSPTPMLSGNSFGRSFPYTRRRDKETVTSSQGYGCSTLPPSRRSSDRIPAGAASTKVKSRDVSNMAADSRVATTATSGLGEACGGGSADDRAVALKSASPGRHGAENSMGPALTAQSGLLPVQTSHSQTNPLTNGDAPSIRGTAPKLGRNAHADVAIDARHAQTSGPGMTAANAIITPEDGPQKSVAVATVSAEVADVSTKQEFLRGEPDTVPEKNSARLRNNEYLRREKCESYHEEPVAICAVSTMQETNKNPMNEFKDKKNAEKTEMVVGKEKIIRKKKQIKNSIVENLRQTTNDTNKPTADTSTGNSSNSANDNFTSAKVKMIFSSHDEGVQNIVITKPKKTKTSSTFPILTKQECSKISVANHKEQHALQDDDLNGRITGQIEENNKIGQKIVRNGTKVSSLANNVVVSAPDEVNLHHTPATDFTYSCKTNLLVESKCISREHIEAAHDPENRCDDPPKNSINCDKYVDNSSKSKITDVKYDHCWEPHVVELTGSSTEATVHSQRNSDLSFEKSVHERETSEMKTGNRNSNSDLEYFPTVNSDQNCAPTKTTWHERRKISDEINLSPAKLKQEVVCGPSINKTSLLSSEGKESRGTINVSTKNDSSIIDCEIEDKADSSASKIPITIQKTHLNSNPLACVSPSRNESTGKLDYGTPTSSWPATQGVQATPTPASMLDGRPVASSKTPEGKSAATANKTDAPNTTDNVTDKLTSRSEAGFIAGSGKLTTDGEALARDPSLPLDAPPSLVSYAAVDILPKSGSTDAEIKKPLKRRVVKKKTVAKASAEQEELVSSADLELKACDKKNLSLKSSIQKDGKQLVKKLKKTKKKCDTGLHAKTADEALLQKPQTATVETSHLLKPTNCPKIGLPKRRVSKDISGNPLHIIIPAATDVTKKVNRKTNNTAKNDNETKTSIAKHGKKGNATESAVSNNTTSKLSKHAREEERKKLNPPNFPKLHADRRGKGSKSIHSTTKSKKTKISSKTRSSSSSASSSGSESEEEVSPSVQERRRIREAMEREEARKLEKFRRRGQRSKLKMERLKMADDPVAYMKNPANKRFAFMMKQEEWLQKHQEEEKKKACSALQPDPADNCPAPTPIDELDDAPFDRRRGPLGGPRPKFRQYKVSDFLFLRVLGNGAFGKVMLARMHGTRNYFAVKCLRKDKIVTDEDVQDTLTERKILTMGTNQPYLCHLFCTFQTPFHLFFVLEFLNGGDLSFHLAQAGRFDADRTRFYACQLVCGLRFLHKRGIIYRDLKLDNVLLDHEGHVRIADFGMCKTQIFLDRMADAFCGTVDYMAPEVVSGKNYNQSVDWWSFGIMLYEMLVGLTPFIGLDEEELFWAIRNEQPYYPRFLDDDCTEIIKWLLVKEAPLRLGSPECPAGGVTSQLFFKKVDWIAVERRQLEPPFKPSLVTMADCRYFEEDYTNQPARLSEIAAQEMEAIQQERFAGFDYTNPNNTD